MTIIAHYRSFGVPTLVGDLLISRRTNPGRPVHIPASRAINDRIHRTRNIYVAALTQKVVLCGDKLVVAWSGSHAQAANLFEAWQPLQHLPEIDTDMVNRLIDNIDEPLRNNLSLIAAIATPRGARLIMHRVEAPRDYGDITEVVAAGSGRAIFHELTRQQAATVRQYNPGAGEEELRHGYDANLLGSLYGEEFATTMPLQNGWGGGFELARLENGRFVKVGRQLLLNFVAVQSGAAWDLRFVPNFRHVDYWRDQTIIQAVEHEIDTNGVILPGRRDVFVVPPPGLPDPDLSGFTPPDLMGQDVVQSWVLLPELNASMVYAASYEMPVLTYDAPVGTAQVHFQFDAMYLDDLIEGLQRHRGAPVHFAGARNRPE
jgi:hypothetical protein